jgi:hypothetical protein
MCCILAAYLLTAPAQGYEIRVLETGHAGNRISINMTAVIARPIDEVYRSLTDFDRLPRLSEAIEESRQLPPDEAGEVIVYTRMHPCVWFVCKTVRIFETVTYPAKYEILSTVIPSRSELAYGQSRWSLSPLDNGTLLQYESELEPGFDLMPLFGRAAAKHSLKKQARQFLQGLEDAR